jgi:hypothetical protein
MDDMITKPVKSFLGKIVEDFVTYLRLYDILKINAMKIFEQKNQFENQEHFWANILIDSFVGNDNYDFFDLQNGQLVEFKDVYLTEWAPKLPGRIWTQEGHKNYIDGLNDKEIRRIGGMPHEVLDRFGKEKVVSAGFGSIRINPTHESNDYFMHMSLVSKEQWHVDYGIPIIVSKKVYENFKRIAKDSCVWLDKVTGILNIQRDIPLRKFIPNAIGRDISNELKSALTQKPFLPKAYVYLPILDTKLRYNNTHPNCTAWTTFQNDRNDFDYAYTYTLFKPSVKDSIQEAVGFIESYIKSYGGGKIITDFDGIVPRLNSIINLTGNPMIQQSDISVKLLTDMDNWVKTSYNRKRYY